MAKRTDPDVEPLSDVLRSILSATKWKQYELAQRFGVSGKTLARWIYAQAVPAPGIRHGLVHALADLDPSLLARFSVALGLGAEVATRLAPPTALDPALARATIEAAIIEAADQLDAAPGRTREALATFVERLAAAGIDRDAARDLLAAPRARKKRVP